MSTHLAQPQSCARPDLVDMILSGTSGSPSGLGTVVGAPMQVADGNGRVLAFATTADLVRGVFQYAAARQGGDASGASRWLGTLSQTLAIESLALPFTAMLRQRLTMAMPVNSADDVVRNGRMSLQELVLRLYCDYAQRPLDEMGRLVSATIERLGDAWRELCATESDEDALSSSRLKDFYEGLEFPLGCTFRRLAGDSLTVAHAALPLLAASQHKVKAAFDFGGNSGLIPAAMAANGIERVLLADFSRSMLDFARWRDRRMGLGNVEYLELEGDGEASSLDSLAGSFDFGVCTEVLEHIADVEAAIAKMAKLLRVGGILFQSASFGHYPYPTHLRRNLVYAGHEDELMERFNFKRLPWNFPITPRDNERLYTKTA